jgi:hypothetical protein
MITFGRWHGVGRWPDKAAFEPAPTGPPQANDQLGTLRVLRAEATCARCGTPVRSCAGHYDGNRTALTMDGVALRTCRGDLVERNWWTGR